MSFSIFPFCGELIARSTTKTKLKPVHHWVLFNQSYGKDPNKNSLGRLPPKIFSVRPNYIFDYFEYFSMESQWTWSIPQWLCQQPGLDVRLCQADGEMLVDKVHSHVLFLTITLVPEKNHSWKQLHCILDSIPESFKFWIGIEMELE